MGGLIGPPGTDLTRVGSLEGTPTLLLSGDLDPHVPWVRVQESAAILQQMERRWKRSVFRAGRTPFQQKR